MTNPFMPKSFKKVESFKQEFKYVYKPNDDSYLFLYTLIKEIDLMHENGELKGRVFNIVEIG